MPTNKPTTIRISAKDRQRIVLLSAKLELSQTDVLKLALKLLAEKEGVDK